MVRFFWLYCYFFVDLRFGLAATLLAAFFVVFVVVFFALVAVAFVLLAVFLTVASAFVVERDARRLLVDRAW